MDFFSRLEARCKEKSTLLCIGLDPRVEAADEQTAADLIVEQNKRIIEATVPYAACYKPNIAFYEAYGSAGLEALDKTLALIPDEIPVLLDAKRNDIGATAEAYAKGAFEHIKADAITLNPYMGKTSADPFLKYQDKGLFFLCRTSNPGAEKIQELPVTTGGDSTPLYLEMARQLSTWGTGNFGLVVGGNLPDALQAVRKSLPDVWFLAPGIGAQGGSMDEAVRAGLRADGLGILANVSRAISNADDPGAAAADFCREMNAARDRVLAENKSAPQRDEDKFAVLKGLIETECFRTGEFTLKSGKKSPFYVDLRRISSDPRLLARVGKAYGKLLKNLKADRIAGIPLAGLPLATAASLESGIPLIYPRMTQKKHGTGNAIEGQYKPGEKVIMLDDLITTGKSKIEAIDILRGEGLIVEDLVVLLERGVQGRQDMTAAGVNLYSYAHVDELFDVCFETGTIDREMYDKMQAFVKES